MKNSQTSSNNFDLPQGPFDPGALLIYGGGGHGKSVVELANIMGSFKVIGIIDDGIEPGERVLGYPVLGGEGVLEEMFSRGVVQVSNAVGAIGDIDLRIKIFQKLSRVGFAFPNLVHPSAVVESSATLSSGIQVFPQSYVGTEVEVGMGVIINNGVIISHDCRLADYVGLAPGVILAGGVTVGSGAQIGMGVTVNLNVSIGERALIGNSAVIKGDVPDGSVVHAGQIWPQRE